MRATLVAECPGNVSLTWLNVGYSTSRRRGGPHSSFYGGSLRAALTLLADAEIVTYLDDDDWFAAEHCADILKAISGRKWAFAYSIYADNETGEGLCIDEIESVGVDKGIYATDFGGFVRPSGLALNKLELLPIVHLWSYAEWPSGDGEDRLIFDRLRGEPHACTGKATVYAAIDPQDTKHAERVAFMRSRGVEFRSAIKTDSARV